MLAETIIKQLVAIVGEPRLLLGDDDLKRFGIDRSTLWTPAPSDRSAARFGRRGAGHC
jgi:hypothetical protein